MTEEAFMTRRAFVLPLLLLSTPAAAEWRLVGQDDFSKVYLDATSRETLADRSVRVRALTDYDPQAREAASFKLSEKGLSEIEQVVFDCEKHAYRSDGGDWREGHMAAGATRSVYPATQSWSKVPSFYAGLFAKACARD
jgi:hypothetical protein